MAECEHCGGFVSTQYVRVFAPAGRTTVRTCPQCPELRRENDGSIRHSTAQQQHA
jgi:hypothetical protein